MDDKFLCYSRFVDDGPCVGKRLSMAQLSCGLVQMVNEGGLVTQELLRVKGQIDKSNSNLGGIGEMGIMAPKAEASWRGAVNVTFTS